MLLQEALKLSQQMIATRAKHMYYDRTCELATKYKALKTGENIGVLIRQFVRREDIESYWQRLALTTLITPAVISALEKPFNKVSYNKKVKKSFDFNTEQRNTAVDFMRQSFYGRKKSKNKGLDYWLRTRFPEIETTDPNAWVVIEWDSPQTQAEKIKPRPFEVPSANAWNFEVESEDVKWLWVNQCIDYNRLVKVQGQKKSDRIKEGAYQPVTGDKWTMYDEDQTIVYTEVDPEYLKSINYRYGEGESLWEDPITKKSFILRVSNPNLGYVPAFRVGYHKDPETESTTFINTWHSAMPYLMKSVKTVSEMDLTMTLHAFPQKMQYVQRCPGQPQKKIACEGGKMVDGTTCPICKGIGVKVHTSAQDALFFPFPDANTPNNEVLDLTKLLTYFYPPVEILNFQKSMIESLKNDCHSALFGQTQLTKVNNTGSAGSGPVTATEANDNIQGVYDALHPFTEKVSDIWIECIYTFGLLATTPPDEDVEITCVFPINPKIKSLDELLSDLKKAFDSGAPAFLIDQINNDIAEVLYEGDDIAEKKYWTKHQFYPFNGQTADEIALNMASNYVSKFTKVLYSNFEAIFADIELENVGFWFLPLNQQWPVVEAMVNMYIEDIDQSNSPNLLITIPPTFPDDNPDNNPDNTQTNS